MILTNTQIILSKTLLTTQQVQENYSKNYYFPYLTHFFTKQINIYKLSSLTISDVADICVLRAMEKECLCAEEKSSC